MTWGNILFAVLLRTEWGHRSSSVSTPLHSGSMTAHSWCSALLSQPPHRGGKHGSTSPLPPQLYALVKLKKWNNITGLSKKKITLPFPPYRSCLRMKVCHINSRNNGCLQLVWVLMLQPVWATLVPIWGFFLLFPLHLYRPIISAVISVNWLLFLLITELIRL